MSWFLLISMAQRMGFIVAIAFLLTRWPRFRNLLNHAPNNREKLILVFIFGFFGIVGTYTGITVSPGEVQHWFPGYLSFEDAIANSRAIGIMAAGLLGGPVTGLGAGLIAGLHRISLGGFTAVACGMSTIFEGLVAGFMYHGLRNKPVSPGMALAVGIAGEMGQMAIILLIAKPFMKAWALVKIIALPMIIANSMGIALFMAILHLVVENDRRVGSIYSQKALSIAEKTLTYLRTGLNYKSALATAEIIYAESGVEAVAITDRKVILSHVGKGSDHHLPGAPILTEATRWVLASGSLRVANSPGEILCKHAGCPLQSAVVVPLRSGNETIGTFKLYYKNRYSPDEFTVNLARGLAQLFSTQLELGQAEKQARLLKDAEIKALQAQINPHFLFNALNTIVSLIRTNPDEARKVLVQLGNYIRQNLKSSLYDRITLETELRHVQAYLAVVQARFSHRLQVTVDVPEQLYHITIPPLTLQPLVENAVQHGFEKITGESRVDIRAGRQGAYVKISVKDNGKGIDPRVLENLLTDEHRVETKGIGLVNVHGRLVGLFGRECGLNIRSSLQAGTEVSFKLPVKTEVE